MIYVTGDCHADFTRFNTKNFPEQYEMTKEDYVIICGDFGGVWNRFEENKHEKHWMDWLEDRPFTTLFCEGNHENFDRLYSYPVEKWNDGNVHQTFGDPSYARTGFSTLWKEILCVWRSKKS